MYIWKSALIVFAVAVVIPLAGSTTTAYAAPTCAYEIPDKGNTGSGDTYFGRDNWNWCRDSWLASTAKAYGMVASTWKPFGWDGACSTDKATGRFFTAVVAMSVAAPPIEFEIGPFGPVLTNYSILHWGPSWVYKALDTLKVSCAKNSNLAFTNWNGHVHLYVPNTFYDVSSNPTPMGVTARASLLIHEVRHKKGKTHKKDGKDSSWGSNGAWRYQAVWLWDYANIAVNAPRGQKCLAEEYANMILSQMFIEPTSKRVRSGACDS